MERLTSVPSGAMLKESVVHRRYMYNYIAIDEFIY